MTTKNMEARREAFEAWAVERRFPIHRDGVVVTYSARCTDEAWQAWNAALDSICVELPQGFTYHGVEDCTKYVLDADEVVEALNAAGVPYK